MNMFEEVASLVPKTRLLELYCEYRPWIKDRTHHYRVMLKYYPVGSPRDALGYREQRWVTAMSDNPHDAMHKVEAALMLRKDR